MTFNPTTWNPLDKSSYIALSNENLTASRDTTSSGWKHVRSVDSVNAGKYYWEILCGSGYTDVKLGIATADDPLESGSFTSVYEWGLYNQSNSILLAVHDQTNISYSVGFTTGDIVSIALDLDVGEIYFAVNGTWIGDGNPATNTNPVFSGLSGDFFAWASLWPSYTEPLEYVTANFGASSFVYSVPSGYSGGLGADSVYLSDSGFIADSVDIGEEFLSDSNGLISDEVFVDRDSEYEKSVSENLTVSDAIDVFNFTRWLEINYARAVQRFYFTLTGYADGVEDIEIPISSFQIRSTGTVRYISVEIPSTEYASEINLRMNGTMIVERAYVLDGIISLRDTIAEASIDGIRVYEGGNSQSITLDGYYTGTMSSNRVDLQQVQTRQVTSGALSSVRCAGLDFLIRPGDVCINGGYEMIADTVIHTVSASQQGVDAYVDITAE